MRPRGLLLVLVGLVVLGSPVGASADGGCSNEGFREAQNSQFLPDCRAYELVSPAHKNGGDVLANSARTVVASDGNAVTFASLAGFGDVQGMGVATEYMAVRAGGSASGSSGWLTHAITPPQASLSYGAIIRGEDPLYEEISPDLSRGVFRAWSPLSDAPNVSNVENLYLRNDLRTPGLGSYQLLSDAVAPVGSSVNALLNSFFPQLAGSSADFEHVIFESRYALTADAPPFPNVKLYESDHAAVRLAGVLPDGSAAPESIAGQGVSTKAYAPHTISADGRRIFFTVPSEAFGRHGVLYMRESDPVTGVRSTVQLNVSERTDCGITSPGESPKVPPACTGAPAPDPNGVQPAEYWNASVDGGRVFFTTAEALTNDAPLNNYPKLYMYDTSKPDSDPHNLTLLSVDSEPADTGEVVGVLGTSADGRYVYFAAIGKLGAGAPSPGPNWDVYLWHDGAVSYIGSVFPGDVDWDASREFNGTMSESRVTLDGRHLLFMSTSGEGLTGYNHGVCANTGISDGSCPELYIYSAADKKVSCASCNPSGAPATAPAVMQIRAHGGGSDTSRALNHAISDDGQRVFFTTGEALVPQDTNGKLDAYEYDVQSGTVHLLSSGRDPSDSYFLNASPSGDDAFILTRERLVGRDTDSAYDLYDVRVGGGFPEPVAAAGCVGEACQGELAAGGGGLAPVSAGFSGGGNLAPAVSRGSSAKGVPVGVRLAGALRSCRRKPRRQQARCESRARKRYGKKASKRGRGK